MAQLIQGQFGYRRVQLIKTEQLGTGSYGAVYKAMLDDLPCAGKILHPTLIKSNDPGAMTAMIRFQKECSFLSAIRHPNIVQYLGSYQDRGTGLPVLLMELMDDSLTRFLKRSQEPLLYHTQVDLCHDVTLAIAYLHSNDIIHRDLSSNNVLLIGAGNRAKVTDFGMAKLFTINHTTTTPHTLCPGTLAYMSPEALDDPPVYAKKLDTFSFGVLDIQIVTQQFPDPGPRVKKVRDPRSPTGRMEMPVLETERRKSHIDLVNPTHPLLPIATDCLSYSEEDRPSAQKLCHCLATLKEAPQYNDSVQQAQERGRQAESTTGEDKERHIRELQQEKAELQQEKDECIEQIRYLQLQISNSQLQELNQQLAASGNSWRESPIRELEQQNKECDEHVQDIKQQLQVNKSQVQAIAAQEEIQQLKQELERTRHVVETMETRYQELTQKLEANETITAQFQQNLLQTEKLNQEMQEENRHLQQELQQERNRTLQQTRKPKFTWQMCKAAPCKMKRGSSTVCGSVAFFKPDGSSQIHSYSIDTYKWCTLPDCPRTDFTLTVINDFMTAVGGIKPGTLFSTVQLTNTLISVINEGEDWKWVELFPRMPTKRKLTAVACSGKTLVVAGGGVNQSTMLTTVEVMDTHTLQWSETSSLPLPLYNPSATICGDRFYLEGEDRSRQHRTAVFACSLSALLQSQPSQPVWCPITDLPAECSTIVTLNGQLLSIGGQGCHGNTYYTNAIYSYNPVTNFWELVNCLPTPRYNCLVAVFPGNKLMVVGGESTRLIDTVEIASVE